MQHKSIIKFIFVFISIFIVAHANAQTQTLLQGWNLIGNDTNGGVDPNSVFGNATTPTSISTSVTTVWTWNNSTSTWDFFAPSMTPTALAIYAASKGYGVLTSIQQSQGFWVNASSPVSISLASSAQPLSFPVQSGYTTLSSNGWARTFSISGTCSGSGSRTTAPANTATTFEGVAALSAASTITMSLANCTPASIAQTSTGYVNNSYLPLGFNSVGVNYGVYLTSPAIPAFVSVGGTGIIGTETLYTDSSKSTGNGRTDVSYVVTADTSTTAIITIIDKIYNAAGILTVTEQDAWRISSTGALSPIKADLQYANGSTTHLVLTYN